MKIGKIKVESGKQHPLGSTPDSEGINFSIFSENATSVELLLFENHDDKKPKKTITLDPIANRNFHYWHVYIRGLESGVHYAYRIDGPKDIHNGHRFNPNKVLIDPYSKGNSNVLWDRAKACDTNDNTTSSMRSIAIAHQEYDWEGDEPLRIPLKDTIIYEMHVRGFTKDPSSKTKEPGTFRGIIEKIPYLKKLGITAVELLPVFEFDQTEIIRENPDKQKLYNYWGYSTVGFFAPEDSYCTNPECGEHLNEFRDMVKALHKAGIEVILDVVFNHTSEGNHLGPMISFKGIDNSIFYHLVDDDKQYYMDYSGCGNTINCNHPIVEKYIHESLEFWVKEMHVDGFRFDEGSILSRSTDGTPMKYPPILWNIELSETFADTKLIAEAWDANGLYQIGSFPGYRWAEWNGRFRDDIRRFVKGDEGLISAVASRISGSSDIYQHSRHTPLNSINFITCHDGFTLMDLVSYNGKHNEINGENNNDGVNDNLSWNCGVEGLTDNQDIIFFRKKQIKNFITLLMLSQGIPMILGGDEFCRTQNGNNNSYCQDNEINWFNWDQVKQHEDILRFVRTMIAFRKKTPTLRRGYFFEGKTYKSGMDDISWHGCELNAPGWNDPKSRVIAFTIAGFSKTACDIHVMANMDSMDLDFEIPIIDSKKWCRYIDTSLPSPDDICNKRNPVEGSSFNVKSHSIVILLSMNNKK